MIPNSIMLSGNQMKTSRCRCNNRIYFNNSVCVGCNAVLGRCTKCGKLSSFSPPASSNGLRCDQCDSVVYRCSNQNYGVCNSFNVIPNSICRWCAFTTVIPDLNLPDSKRRWAALETAKRQLLIQLEQLGLPPFASNLLSNNPLTFEFLTDTTDSLGNLRRVTTGHEDGRIVINVLEADSVQRESLRIRLGEPQRTLIGHMRHEIGHYIDWGFASRMALHEYHKLFGDPLAIDYELSMQTHYAHGAPANWPTSFVSQYATMHPWEDFAETVNVYLDIMAIASTANDQGRAKFDLSPKADVQALVREVLKIVIEVSEYNFDLGLQPLLPEKLSAAALDKLSYVHALRDILAVRIKQRCLGGQIPSFG
jgi:hypothetical protein